jgi:hypothetical protein
MNYTPGRFHAVECGQLSLLRVGLGQSILKNLLSDKLVHLIAAKILTELPTIHRLCFFVLAHASIQSFTRIKFAS